MPVNTAAGTPGYDPVAHYQQISAHFPKPQPVATHVGPPSTGTYPAPHEIASFAANRRQVDRRLGTNTGRRSGDVANPDTLFGEPGSGRSVDFRGAGRFNQPQAPPHVAPVVDPVAPLPSSREGLDAMLAAQGLGPKPQPAGVGGHIKNFFNDEAGTLYWPPAGKPMPPNASSSGDELMKGYGLAPVKPATQPKPSPTGRSAGPIPMRPGPPVKVPPTPMQPGLQEFAAQQAYDARLGGQTAGMRPGSGDVSGFANRGPAPQVAGAAGIGEPDLAAMRALHTWENPAPPVPQANGEVIPRTIYKPELNGSLAQNPVPPVPQAQAQGEAIPRTPMYNPELHGSRANYDAIRSQWAAKLGGAAPGPVTEPFPEPAVRPGMFRANAGTAAKGVGLGLMFNAVNDPAGTADLVRHPGNFLQGQAGGFRQGLNRIASGNVGPTDLVNAVGDSLGMRSAFTAGMKMGNTGYDAYADPRRFGTNFMNGLGVIGKGIGF